MNTSIVIALPKIEDAKKIRTVLNRYGFTVAAVCNSGANALASISELDGGVLLMRHWKHLYRLLWMDQADCRCVPGRMSTIHGKMPYR